MKQDFNQLKRNTIIIAIANLGSKVIAFILAPLYSFFMTTAEYGTMDVINSTISLVIPFICLDIYEATFRYSSDLNYDKKKVFSSSIGICIPGLLISLLVIGIAPIIECPIEYIVISMVCIFLGGINSVMTQFLRGSNRMKLFALTGVISAIGLLVSNFVFLVLLDKGIQGWLISFLISKIVEFIYLCITCDFKSNFSIRAIDKEYIFEFVKFALPLMPTTIMWWIMNLSDRYIITAFIGASATGIYAVASKIPSLLSVFENIFYQAWQTTAISTYQNEDRDNVYSKVFNNYLGIMVIGVLGLLLISKPATVLLFDTDYVSAWKYIPPLVIGVVVHALSGNLGSLYSVFKNTKGALYSTFIGAMVNIILNIIFIPIIGIMGAALTTLVGYLVTFAYRWFDTKRFVHLKIQWKDTVAFVALILVQLVLYYVDGMWSYLVRGAIILGVIIWKRKLILGVIKR